MSFTEDMTLQEARDVLRTLLDDGHECPCCRQFAKVYRRKIHATMAKDLILIYRQVPVGEWFHLADTVGYNGGDTAKLAYWSMMEEETTIVRDDGGRAGYWRLAPSGAAWARGETVVQKYARVYDGRCLSLVGDPVDIRDALGGRFRYDDLMAGV